MPEKTYLQAISDGLRQEMRRDKRVFVIGQDVGVYGGAFKVTLGFQEEFGPWRVIDAPLSETAILGGATGAAIMGMRPVAEMQFADFVSCGWDHLVTVAAKQRWRAGTPGADHAAPALGRRVLGRAVPLAEPRVVVRAHPRPEVRLPVDAGGREGPARRRRSRIRTRCSSSSTSTSTGGSRARCRTSATRRRSARRASTGRARTSPSSPGARWCTRPTEAAAELDDVSVEIVDLRSILPWDKEAVLESVRKTSKVLVLHEDTHTGGFGAEIAATIAEEAFEHLDAPPRRIAAPDTPVPFSPALERAFIPQVADVAAGAPRAGGVLGRGDRHRSRGRHAADGRLGLRGDDHEVAEERRRHGRGRRAAARDLDRQGRHRGAEPGHRRRDARSSSRRARRSTSERCSRGSAARPAPPRPSPSRAEPEPAPEPEPSAEPATQAAADAAMASADGGVREAPEKEQPPPRRPRPRTPNAGNGRAAAEHRFVSPVVARIAAEHGIDPATVEGTGRGGRVTKKDILAFVEAAATRPPRRPQAPPAPAAPAQAPAPARRTGGASARSRRPRRTRAGSARGSGRAGCRASRSSR